MKTEARVQVIVEGEYEVEPSSAGYPDASTRGKRSGSGTVVLLRNTILRMPANALKAQGVGG